MPEGGGRGANFGWPCFEGAHVLETPVPAARRSPTTSPRCIEYANPPAGGGRRQRRLRDPRPRASLAPGPLRLRRHIRRRARHPCALAGAGRRQRRRRPGRQRVDPRLLRPGRVRARLRRGAGRRASVSRLEPASGAALACKTAPVLRLDAGAAAAGRQAGRGRGGGQLRRGLFAPSRARGSGSSAPARRRPFAIGLAPVTARVQLEARPPSGSVLPKRAVKRLRRALKAKRRAVAEIEVSAGGAGGGTALASAKGEAAPLGPSR